MDKNSDVYIPAFYAGRTIFITGGTGFMGKVLIEKLLRSCPDVRKIFMLMRPKKGQNVNDRLKKMLDNKLFDLLRSKQPSSFDKIIPITGNVAAENLGLELSDRKMLIDHVSIIFHIAASVRFDDSLKNAILINARSTRDVCILAKKMKKLVVLLHVSSTYTQCDKHVVEEIVYPSEFDYKKAIKIVETIDEGALKVLTMKCLGPTPNTYIFSKRLAEQVISDYSETLPCIIFRPSIVVSTLNDPVKGWIDNFNGPAGMNIGGGKGILRVLWSDPDINSDYMAADIAIKAMIIAAWIRGNKTKDKMIDVYNCSSNLRKSLNCQTLVHIGFELIKSIPFENILWKPQTVITKSSFVYYILVLLLHITPAILLDAVMKLFGVRPIMLKLQRKVYVSNKVLSYFLLNKWQFQNDKMLNMLDNLNAENQNDFGINYNDVDLMEYYKNGIIGAKIYLLNENMDNLEAAKRHYKSAAHRSYLLEDYRGKSIAGAFYEHELNRVANPDVYLVVKVLRRTGDKVYVKWLGFDGSHNSWIHKDSVI